MTILNTNYGGGGENYTAGDGIDITNDVISVTNTGKAKALTTADYNYPTDNPNCVALWLLDTGFYYATPLISVKPNSLTQFENSHGLSIILGKGDTSVRSYVGEIGGGGNASRIGVYQAKTRNGQGLSETTLLDLNSVQDDLTTSSAEKVLSANQGKVLKDLVDSLAIRGAGAPTTTTAGQVGTLYEDTTNGKLYICTDATNPYVWEEVGGSGTSGMKQLTTNDYNWPENNPDGIAPWLLDLGWYITSDNLKIYPSSTTGSYYTSIYGQIYCIGRGNGMGSGQRFVFNLGSGAAIPATQWSGATYTRWFDDNGVVTASEYLVGSARLDERISRRVGAPLSSSKGVLGEFWTDKNTGKTYKCVGANDVSGVYDWEEAITNPSGLLINGGTTAPTTATVGQIGTQYTYVDTTGTPTAHLCVCVEIDDTTDPDNPSYTWQTLI